MIVAAMFIINLAGGQPAMVATYSDMGACLKAVKQANDQWFMGQQFMRLVCIPVEQQ